MDADQARRVRQFAAKVLEQYARGIGSEDRAGLQTRFDRGMDFQLQLEIFGHGFQYQISLFNTAVVRVGDQPVEHVACFGAGQVFVFT